MPRPLRMLLVPLAVLIAASGVLTLGPGAASANRISLDVSCPGSVATGATVTLEVRVENRMCETLTGRVITSLVGNAADIASGSHSGAIGVFPPKVATDTLQIAGAFDPQPAVCAGNGLCTGNTPSFCTTDDDCQCRPFLVTPTVTVVPVQTADPFPAVFEGVQVQQVVVVDVPGTRFTDEDICTIPEAGPAASALAGLAAMLTLRADPRRRQARADVGRRNARERR